PFAACAPARAAGEDADRRGPPSTRVDRGSGETADSSRTPEGSSVGWVCRSWRPLPPPRGRARDADDLLVLLADAQLGGVDEAVDDVEVVLDPVVDELRLLVPQDEERRGFSHEHGFGEPDERPSAVVEDLDRGPRGLAFLDLDHVVEVQRVEA